MVENCNNYVENTGHYYTKLGHLGFRTLMTATLCVCACMQFQQAEADAQTFLTGISKIGSYMAEI